MTGHLYLGSYFSYVPFSLSLSLVRYTTYIMYVSARYGTPKVFTVENEPEPFEEIEIVKYSVQTLQRGHALPPNNLTLSVAGNFDDKTKQFCQLGVYAKNGRITVYITRMTVVRFSCMEFFLYSICSIASIYRFIDGLFESL